MTHAVDTAVVRALRTARQRKRLVSLEWFELAYKVYVIAFVGIVAIALISNWVGDQLLTESQVADLHLYAPPVVGAVLALIVALGLRAGARGGPISVESADVQYLLLAPVSRRAALARPAAQQLRRGGFIGLAAGAVGGQLLGRRLDDALIPWTTSGAVVGAVLGASFATVALVAHVVRLRRWQATMLGAALLAWQCCSIPADWNVPGPLSTLGSLVLWPSRVHAVDLVLPVVALLLAGAGMYGLEHLSLDALARRSALVSQLRFAVTMRDLRTVVLLRRQLSNEQHRTRPWFRLPQRLGTAVIRRGVQSVARFPVSRLVRMALLTAIAVVAQVAAFRGTTPAIVLSGLAAFVLGLECLEPFAQEVDQTDRCDALPHERGWLLVRHLVVPGMVAAVFGALGAAGAALAFGTSLAWELSFLLALPVVWAGSAGAVLNVMAGLPSPTLPGSTSDLLPPEIAGSREVLRTLWPLLVAVSGSVPVIAAREAAEDNRGPLPPALQVIVAVALVVAGVVWWARKRDEIRMKGRALWAAGDAEFQARHGRPGGTR